MKHSLLIVSMMFAVTLAACAANQAAVPDTSPVEVTLLATDIAYDKTEVEAVAGRPVRLTLDNDGVLEHDFSILELPHTGEVAAEEHEEEMGHDMSALAEQPEIHVAAPAGDSAAIEFTPSTPGEYEYYCTVSGHKEAGMVGTLIVKAP